MSQEMLVDIQHLTIRFGRKVVVNDLSLQVAEGERIAIVGESGSGKTLTGLSLIGLLPEGGDVTGSVAIKLGGEQTKAQDLLKLSEKQLQGIRGKDVAMIFQEPMTALNPLYTVGNQIMEAVQCHEPSHSQQECKARAIALLTKTGIPKPEERFSYYPHLLS